MKLLALITDGFGAAGGIARYNQDLMTALLDRGTFEEIVVLPRFGAAGVELPRGLRQLSAVPDRLAWMRQAASLVARQRFDAIFCGHLFAAPLAAVLARSWRLPLWLQAHGIEAWHPSGRFARRDLSWHRSRPARHLGDSML